MIRLRFLMITMIPSLLLMTGIFQTDSQAQVREYQSLLLNDLGVVQKDRNGEAYVTINPLRCRALGPELCEFFRQHEYGHVNLNHLDRRLSTRQAEIEADCYAAKHVSPSVAQAAVDWFNSGNGASRVHGSSEQRANRVASCSQNEQPIEVPNRSRTLKFVPAKRSYSSNASSNSSSRNVTLRSSTPQSSRSERPVYVRRPTTERAATAPEKTVYVRAPTTGRTTTSQTISGQTQRTPATRTVTRTRILVQSKPNCR